MGRITLFVTPECNASEQAHATLQALCEDYNNLIVIDLTVTPHYRPALVAMGLRTVPQTFLNDQLLGSWDTIQAMLRLGLLPGLVQQCENDPLAPTLPFLQPPALPDDISRATTPQSTTPPSPNDPIAAEAPLWDAELPPIGMGYSKLLAMVKHADRGIPVTRRIDKFRVYESCWVASEMVDWLLSNINPDMTRQDAVAIGQALLDGGLATAVDRTTPFKDDHTAWFRWAEDEPIEPLNLDVPWQGAPTTSLDLTLQLRLRLHAVHTTFCGGGTIDWQRMLKSDLWEALINITPAAQAVNWEHLDTHHRIAFALNLHNTLALHALAVYGVPERQSGWTAIANSAAYYVGNNPVTLNDLRDGVLRGNRPPPGTYLPPPFAPGDYRQTAVIQPPDLRCHFAMTRMTSSCPEFRVYSPQRLDVELNSAAEDFIQRWVTLNEERAEIVIPAMFRRFASDFGNENEELSALQWASPFLSMAQNDILTRLQAIGVPPVIKYHPYVYDVPGLERTAPAMADTTVPAIAADTTTATTTTTSGTVDNTGSSLPSTVPAASPDPVDPNASSASPAEQTLVLQIANERLRQDLAKQRAELQGLRLRVTSQHLGKNAETTALLELQQERQVVQEQQRQLTAEWQALEEQRRQGPPEAELAYLQGVVEQERLDMELVKRDMMAAERERQRELELEQERLRDVERRLQHEQERSARLAEELERQKLAPNDEAAQRKMAIATEVERQKRIKAEQELSRARQRERILQGRTSMAEQELMRRPPAPPPAAPVDVKSKRPAPPPPKAWNGPGGRWARLTVPLGMVMHLKHTFRRVDTVGHGRLSVAQLGQWLNHHGVNGLDTDSLHRMVKQVDVHNIGCVNFWGFLTINLYITLQLHGKVDLTEWAAFIQQSSAPGYDPLSKPTNAMVPALASTW